MKKTSMIAAVLLLVACGSASHLTPPANFLALDENEEGYAQRATSAEGVVIATRELDNDHEGTLAFWVEAIKQRMQHTRGYALTAESDISIASGQRGKQLRFGHDEAGGPYVYWLNIFVEGDRVFIVEAGGKQDLFTTTQPQIEQAIAAYRF
ncbi:MAG: serine/threonine protein kinase [Sandaracinaceae bacterium]|jgi:hypothetical protein|nr:serine/threonine protein kinase [Sandaracinaceae bacterium]